MVKESPLPYNYQEPQEAWRALRITRDPSDFSIAPKTGIPSETFEKILDHLTSLPENFKPVPQVNRLLRGMNRLLENDTLNWGWAELAAYGSILVDGKDIRMSGRDVQRGPCDIAGRLRVWEHRAW